MKNLNLKAFSLIALTVFSSLTFAQGSSQHSGNASKHGVLASGHLVVGTAKGVASVVALPLIAIGSVGMASAATGSAIIRSNRPFEPLEITEIIITQDPSPARAMQ